MQHSVVRSMPIFWNTGTAVYRFSKSLKFNETVSSLNGYYCSQLWAQSSSICHTLVVHSRMKGRWRDRFIWHSVIKITFSNLTISMRRLSIEERINFLHTSFECRFVRDVHRTCTKIWVCFPFLFLFYFFEYFASTH